MKANKRMKSRLLGLLLASTLASAISGCATHGSSSANHTEQALKANPADVGTIADILRASYETISGPARNPWPWGRDRTLYMPQAIFVSNSVDHGQVKTLIETPEDYRRRFIAGAYETEVGHHIERYGNVAQVPERVRCARYSGRADQVALCELLSALLGWDALVDCRDGLGSGARRSTNSRIMGRQVGWVINIQLTGT